MTLWHYLRVLSVSGKGGIRKIMAEGLTTFGSLFMYTVIVFAYAGVFRWLSPDLLAQYNLTYAKMVGYVCITEFVLFCATPILFKEFQNDILGDQIDLELVRPCPIWVVRMGEWMGRYIGRLMVLAVPCYCVCQYLTTGQGLTLAMLPGIVLSLPLAGVIRLVSHFIVGMTCLWLGQSEPIAWVWQKSEFLFGALLWPLAFYPPVLAKLAWFTPFPSLLTAPASWALDASWQAHIGSLSLQLFWCVVFLAATMVADNVLCRHVRQGLK
ncbi:MAG: hypothetical protein JO253_06470 [Alphaproteobacteria bacterium]|nr:hypothetical protein [Alphaproteobacteria bacterium]